MKSELELLCSIHPRPIIGDYSIDVTSVEKGIIFAYAEWNPIIVQLKNLLHSLADSSNVPLYIYDIDDSNSIDFFDRNGLYSEGWGEILNKKEGS